VQAVVRNSHTDSLAAGYKLDNPKAAGRSSVRPELPGVGFLGSPGLGLDSLRWVAGADIGRVLNFVG